MSQPASVIHSLLKGLCTGTAEATQAVARELASEIPPDTVLALHGDLGTGKTTFVGGLARGWGIRETVTSPSYNLYTIYSSQQRQLIHFDAYRLSSEADLDALMIEDFLQSPWCFAIEWPERIEDSLPGDAWHIDLKITEDHAHHLQLRLPNP